MQVFGFLGDKMNLKYYLGIGMLGSSLALGAVALFARFNIL
jgi:hypothetical protein